MGHKVHLFSNQNKLRCYLLFLVTIHSKVRSVIRLATNHTINKDKSTDVDGEPDQTTRWLRKAI